MCIVDAVAVGIGGGLMGTEGSGDVLCVLDGATWLHKSCLFVAIHCLPDDND